MEQDSTLCESARRDRERGGERRKEGERRREWEREAEKRRREGRMEKVGGEGREGAGRGAGGAPQSENSPCVVHPPIHRGENMHFSPFLRPPIGAPDDGLNRAHIGHSYSPMRIEALTSPTRACAHTRAGAFKFLAWLSISSRSPPPHNLDTLFNALSRIRFNIAHFAPFPITAIGYT